MSIPSSIQVPRLIDGLQSNPNQSKAEKVIDSADSSETPNKKMLIIHSKTIEKSDLDLLSKFGRVIKFNPSLINIDLHTINFDYLLIDSNDKSGMASAEEHYDSDFVFAHYSHFFEKDHFDSINAFTKFKDAKDKASFDKLLLKSKQLERPSKWKSCLSFIVNGLAELKK